MSTNDHVTERTQRRRRRQDVMTDLRRRTSATPHDPPSTTDLQKAYDGPHAKRVIVRLESSDKCVRSFFDQASRK